MITLLLGSVGGIIGIVESLVNMASKGGTHPGVNAFSIIALLASTIGTAGSLLSFRVARIGGWMMVVGAVVGFAMINITFLPPGVLLLLAGLIGIFTKPQEKIHSES